MVNRYLLETKKLSDYLRTSELNHLDQFESSGKHIHLEKAMRISKMHAETSKFLVQLQSFVSKQ